MHKKTHMMRDTDDKLNMRLKKRLLKDSNGSWFTKRFGIQKYCTRRHARKTCAQIAK